MRFRAVVRNDNLERPAHGGRLLVVRTRGRMVVRERDDTARPLPTLRDSRRAPPFGFEPVASGEPAPSGPRAGDMVLHYFHVQVRRRPTVATIGPSLP